MIRLPTAYMPFLSPRLHSQLLPPQSAERIDAVFCSASDPGTREYLVRPTKRRALDDH